MRSEMTRDAAGQGLDGESYRCPWTAAGTLAARALEAVRLLLIGSVLRRPALAKLMGAAGRRPGGSDVRGRRG